MEERDRERESCAWRKDKMLSAIHGISMGEELYVSFLTETNRSKKKRFIFTGFFELHVIGVQSKNRNLNLGCPT